MRKDPESAKEARERMYEVIRQEGNPSYVIVERHGDETRPMDLTAIEHLE